MTCFFPFSPKKYAGENGGYKLRYPKLDTNCSTSEKSRSNSENKVSRAAVAAEGKHIFGV